MIYNFLKEENRRNLNANRVMILRFYGENTQRVKCLNPRPIFYMRFVDDTTFTNTNQISFHVKKPVPNFNWPWPFRNWGGGSVRIDGFDLLNEQDSLLFKLEDKHHLCTGDTLEYKPGSVTITL